MPTPTRFPGKLAFWLGHQVRRRPRRPSWNSKRRRYERSRVGTVIAVHIDGDLAYYTVYWEDTGTWEPFLAQDLLLLPG